MTVITGESPDADFAVLMSGQDFAVTKTNGFHGTGRRAFGVVESIYESIVFGFENIDFVPLGGV